MDIEDFKIKLDEMADAGDHDGLFNLGLRTAGPRGRALSWKAAEVAARKVDDHKHANYCAESCERELVQAEEESQGA